MSKNSFLILVAIAFLEITGSFTAVQKEKPAGGRFISYVVDPKKQDIRFYLKDDKQTNFKSIQNLRWWLYQRRLKLLFAVNGGMYKQDNLPQGLFVQNQKLVTPIDTSSGNGNFYVKPNGVFYITTGNVPGICETTDYAGKAKVKYATQSGPMLVVDGQIHQAFKEGSINRNIRNGVGILPNNLIVFVMSKKEINFYDFANYFKHLGCKYALYLDGLVSRTYLPEKDWVQMDGNFGVIIGVTKPMN